jgi:hypothetical protein
MGQKSNLISLRFSNNFNFYSRLNFQEFLYSFSFLNFLTFLFLKKKLFLTNSFFFFFENKIFLTCFLFYRIAKLVRFKKFKKSLLKIKKVVYLNNIKTIFNNFKLFKNNLIIFTFINLNIYLKKKKKKISFFFKNLKKTGLLLFPRRFNFFLDFIQLSILFLENKIDIKFFISIISEIFRILQKKIHAKFFLFINKYFQFLVSNPFKQILKSNILGIKFCINGKLKGKTRSNSYIFTTGTVPIQSLNAPISYAKTHAFTIYGVFGFKLWIYRN